MIIRYGMTNVGSDVSTMRVKPMSKETRNLSGPPDILLLELSAIRSKKARVQLMNKTLSYTFKGEVKDVAEGNEIDQKATFDPEIFFNVLLPPIIFHAGYSMKKRFFFRNIGSILTFAFIGTTISTFVIGGFMYGVTRIFPHLSEIFSFLDTLHFGALISATDPVTVLAIFNDLHVDVNLYAIVFGESVLNDAVAIVLSRTLEDYEKSANSGEEVEETYKVVLTSIGEFLGIFGASFLVGSVMSAATALLTKFTHIRNYPQLESTLFILMSYSTFLLAEVLNLTGIVAVLFCGICQAHYTYNNLSDESRSITKHFFDQLNFMAENFIFSYIGVSMFTFPKHRFHAGFIGGAFVSIILGRALLVYPLCFLLNLGRKTKITLNLQHMMFLSGLRGAIAFALAIRNTLSESRKMILTTTLLIVMVTVIVCGGSTMSLLTWLGIPLGVQDEENAPITSPTHHYNTVDHDNPNRSPLAGEKPGKSWMAKLWSGFDTRYMKPFLTHSNPTLMETLPSCCLPLGRWLTSDEQLARHPAMMSREEYANQESRLSEEANEPEAGGAFGGAEGKNNDSGSAMMPQLTSPNKNGASLNVVKQMPSHI